MILGDAVIFGRGGATPFAYVAVTYPASAICTCTNGVQTLQARDTSGRFIFCVPSSGTWTVSAANGSDTDSKSVSITQPGRVSTLALHFGAPISALQVGDSVYMNVNNVRKEFLVVQQGRPSDIYSTTFDDGTILLMKDIYEKKAAHSSDVNDYGNSTIHSYLNNGFLAMFDADIQSAIKQVKVPYRSGSGTSKTVTSGENGLSAKIFLLSMTELGFSESYQPTNEGTKLSYFDSGKGTAANAKRIAKLNGSITYWWTRSPYCDNTTKMWLVWTDGSEYWNSCTTSYGIRPALVLPNTIKLDDQHNILA